MKYDNIIDDFQILGCYNYVKFLEKEINRFCVNSMRRYDNGDWDRLCSLIEIKRTYLLRYYNFGQIMKFFSKQERYILYTYFYKNKTAEYVSKKTKVSIRTFFRNLEKLVEKYEFIKNAVTGGGGNG